MDAELAKLSLAAATVAKIDNPAVAAAAAAARAPPADRRALSKEEAEEIKEFHFHVYWHTSDPSARAAALALRDDILRLNALGFFVAVPLARVNEGPIGPHPMGSYEVWVPTEHFARFYQWIVRNRNEKVSVLLHPLSKEEVLDHTTRAVFMGPSAPLWVDVLRPKLEHWPLQYPELGLGYSRPADQDGRARAEEE
ncbi:DOPA-like domain-containing protein [Zopfochytrium polystomum]|nr:DOPA-like domain-containing protein [Zopfochytrium polystomum]